MKNTSKLVTTICEIGIFAALGFVIDELQGVLTGALFPSGGSIGFAMIVVLIIAYRRGVLPAVLTGLIMGIFDIATKAYILHPAQVLLDYIFPYALVGLAGFFKPLFDKTDDKKMRITWLIVGTVVGGLLKFLSHYFAGVFFWNDQADFAWNLNYMNPWLYCFIYNIAFIGPSIVLTAAILVVFYLRAPKAFVPKYAVSDENLKNVVNPIKIVLSVSAMAVGTFIFIFFLIKYINSYKLKDYETMVKISFDKDSMVIFVLGLFLAIMGTNNLVKYFKDKFSYFAYSAALSGLLTVSFIYAVYRLIESYVEKEDPTLYWIWFAIGLVTLAGGVTFFVLSLINRRKAKRLESVEENI